MVLSAEAGVGKSRLIDEFLRTLIATQRSPCGGECLYRTGHDHRRNDLKRQAGQRARTAAAFGLRPHAAARTCLILIVAGVSSCLSRDRLSPRDSCALLEQLLLASRSLPSSLQGTTPEELRG
ncbi:MAG: hypothetical protein ACI9DC_000614 [Gammaproteobacteria bacterium]|jgi:hypothetical protein